MRERALERVGVGVGVLARVLLDVEVAAVVVDHDVQVDPAEPRWSLCWSAVTGRPVAGHIEACEALDIHVQQRARFGPLKALERLALTAPTARKVMTHQHRMHG